MAQNGIFGIFEGQYHHEEAEFQETAGEVLFRIENCTTYIVQNDFDF